MLDPPRSQQKQQSLDCHTALTLPPPSLKLRYALSRLGARREVAIRTTDSEPELPQLGSIPAEQLGWSEHLAWVLC